MKHFSVFAGLVAALLLALSGCFRAPQPEGPTIAPQAEPGTYQLRNRATGSCLQGTLDSGFPTKMASCNGQASDQQWQLERISGNLFHVKNVGSSRRLDVENAATTSNTRTVTWTPNSGQNQVWLIEQRSGTFQQLRPNHATANCLDRNGSSAANTIVYTCAATNTNQDWELVTVTPKVYDGTAGPGLTKQTFTQADLFQSLSLIQTADDAGAPRGHGLTTMHNGYLAFVYGRDSGQSGGGFAFFDISNPRAPVLVAKRDVPSLRESHGITVVKIGGREVVALQSGTGVEFWDWTDVKNTSLVGKIDLPGVNFSDYGVGAWWLHWQAPYVYVGGSGNGIFVINASNPAAPTLLKQVPVSATGGFRIHPVFPVGNLLVATSVDFGGSSTGIVTLDISDPANPTVIKTQNTGLPVLYSAFFGGNKLIGLGNFDHKVYVWDLTNPAAFPKLGEVAGMDRPVYATIQDQYALVGDETSYVKLDMSTPNPTIVGEGTSGLGDRSEDIITPLGNLAFVGNDHGTGSAIIVSQTAPDNQGPAVTMVSPANNAVNQKLTSRIGITVGDWIDIDSLSSASFTVRPVGGQPLSGLYSSQTGIINFSPSQPLAANTTYEVVVTAGGMKDFSGNGVPTTFTSRFSTGGTITSGPVAVDMAQPSPSLVGSAATFSIASSSGSGTLQYAWNFGDGSATTAFSTSTSAQRSYSQPGHYTVTVDVRDASGNTARDIVTHTVSYPRTATQPTASSTIILDSATNRVWSVNTDANTVTAVDANSHNKLLEVSVGQAPRTLAKAPDGTIWVVNQKSSTISVLNASSGGVTATIALPYGSRPYGIAFAPNGSAAFVTTQGTQEVIRLSPSSRSITTRRALGFPLRGVAVDGTSAAVYVTRFISPANQGQVLELSASSLATTRTYALAFDTNPDGNVNGRGLPNFVSSLTISPDGRTIRVPSKKDNLARGQLRDGQALNFESMVRTIVSELDLTTRTEQFGKRVDLNDRDMANAVVYSPLGDYVLVATQGTNTIEIFDAYNNRLLTSIPEVGLAPQGLVLSANGQKLFVQNFMSRTVSVYDVSGVLNSTTNVFNELAEVDAVSNEQLSAQVLLGKQIFYNARDTRMGRDSYISCASCHVDGEEDGQVWDFTDRGEGLRNTISLLGRAGTGHGRVHWSANFDEIQDFEHDIRGPFAGTGFMSNTAFNSGTRNTPLGDKKAGQSADLDALAAFVSSLTEVPPSPYRNPDGSLAGSATSGKALFTQYCTSCHGGPSFTDSASGMLHDVGTIKASSGKRSGQPLTGIDTPTLKGVYGTAPYLHDGSAATLRDVLLQANSTGKHGRNGSFSSTEIDGLVSYLQQIDESETAGTTPLNYHIKNVASGRLLDVEGASTTAGARVTTWTATGGTNQVWLVGLRDNGYQQLRPSHATGLCLDRNGSATTHTLTWTCQPSNTFQDWQVLEVTTTPERRVQFKNRSTGTCLAAPAANNYVTQMQTCQTTATDQLWLLSKAP